MMSILFAALAFVAITVLLCVRFVLRIVNGALREIARDEIKAAIPEFSIGLARLAASELPEEERTIVEEFETRLSRLEKRPLAMLALAVTFYRERRTLAAEVAEPIAETAPRESRVPRASSPTQGAFSFGVRLASAARFFARGRAILGRHRLVTYLLVPVPCLVSLQIAGVMRTPSKTLAGVIICQAAVVAISIYDGRRRL
jgi:hypothetical protein